MSSVVQVSEVPETEFQPQQLLMLLLCVYSIGALAAETFGEMSTEQVATLDVIDNVICGIFLIDFVVGLWLAQDKFRFLAWGWIDLVSSIPVIDMFRAGRIVRVIRILRVLRGIRLARILTRYLQQHRANGAFLAIIFCRFFFCFFPASPSCRWSRSRGRIFAQLQTLFGGLW